MALLYNVPMETKTKYYSKYFATFEKQMQAVKSSSTVYVGNLAFITPEERIYEVFSRCGTVHKVIMGINKYSRVPCGFCFVIFERREDAENAVNYISGLSIDGSTIRVEKDWGFSDGRQYGRAKDGGQIRHYVEEIKRTEGNRKGNDQWNHRENRENRERRWHDDRSRDNNRGYRRPREDREDREDKRRRY